MKNYYQLLEEYIEKSNLTITEVANRLNEMGIQVDRTYISKLKNNKTAPASEEINNAIAKVTKGDPLKLNFAAFAEKIPTSLKSLLEEAFELQEYFNIELLSLGTKGLLDEQNEVVNFLNKKGLKSFSDIKKVLRFVIKELTLKEKSILIQLLDNELKIKKNITSVNGKFDATNLLPIESLLKDNEVPNFIRVFGDGLYREGDFSGYLSIDNFNLDNSESFFALEIQDDSLKELNVQPGEKALVFLRSEQFDNENIYLVSYGNEPATFRKIQTHGDYLLLRPLNSNMQIEIIEHHDVNIIGRLMEIKTNNIVL